MLDGRRSCTTLIVDSFTTFSFYSLYQSAAPSLQRERGLRWWSLVWWRRDPVAESFCHKSKRIVIVQEQHPDQETPRSRPRSGAVSNQLAMVAKALKARAGRENRGRGQGHRGRRRENPRPDSRQKPPRGVAAFFRGVGRKQRLGDDVGTVSQRHEEGCARRDVLLGVLGVMSAMAPWSETPAQASDPPPAGRFVLPCSPSQTKCVSTASFNKPAQYTSPWVVPQGTTMSDAAPAHHSVAGRGRGGHESRDFDHSRERGGEGDRICSQGLGGRHEVLASAG